MRCRRAFDGRVEWRSHALWAASVAFALAPSLAQAQSVRLHAAGSLREAFTQIAQRFEQDTGVRVTMTFGARPACRGRGEQRLRVREHGASAIARRCRHRRGAGTPLRVRSTVRARRTQARARARSVALRDARPRAETRHLDAARRPCRRLCMAGLREGGRAATGGACGSRSQGTQADRRTRYAATAGRSQHLWVARRARRRGPVPHLLHERGTRAAARFLRCASSRGRPRSRSGPTTGW